MKEKIQSQLKEAMQAKDEIRLSVLRGLLSGFTNELVAKGQKPDEKISDENALAVVQRQVRQRKDSIEQFEKGGRQDLADKEKEELKILEEFMPEMMSREEIEKVVEAKKAELGENANVGALMGSVMKELKGKADGNLVKEIVENSLN